MEFPLYLTLHIRNWGADTKAEDQDIRKYQNQVKDETTVYRREITSYDNIKTDQTVIYKKISIQKTNFSFDRYIGEHKLALLLDYDGTLAPIAPHPDLAVLPNETKVVLERLSKISDVYISIISGRNVNNVKSMVCIISFVTDIYNLFYKKWNMCSLIYLE